MDSRDADTKSAVTAFSAGTKANAASRIARQQSTLFRGGWWHAQKIKGIRKLSQTSYRLSV